MPAEKFDYKIYENNIEISPEGGVKDNSIYEIKLYNVKAKAAHKVPFGKLEFKITTKLTPSHSSLEAVRTVVERQEVSEHDVLYYIREASLFAEYITGIKYKPQEVPYEVKQFVKFRAAYDSLLKFYVEKAAAAGTKGTLSEVSFEHSNRFPDIKDLLDSIKKEVDYWEEHLRGYGFEGRAKPAAATKGSGLYDTMITSYSRMPVDFSNAPAKFLRTLRKK